MIGVGLLLLGVVIMLVMRRRSPAFFRGEILTAGTPALVVDEPWTPLPRLPLGGDRPPHRSPPMPVGQVHAMLVSAAGAVARGGSDRRAGRRTP
ncbi:hypothetical protein [Streptomyces sp. NPDC014006]|uniref:hypothetical protein n=1 Tax=Streptomyces sp. NPDC014006 TaxID=3364870 RepID=UPI0036F7A671